MPDGRKRCYAAPPGGRRPRAISVYLSPDDYRRLYDLVMEEGTSIAETVRILIRRAHKEPEE